MFSKPANGWTNLKLGELSLRASYLTDIPMDCLDSFIFALQNHLPAIIFFDAEGWDFHLASSYYRTYIVLDLDEVETFVIDKNIKEITQDLINNIELYFKEWVDWECWDDKDEEELEKRRKVLKEKVNILKLLIEKG